ncbi:tetratricopeptide repeat protein [Burkholderia gladioli]|uniref:tetratricopeptide repeat protein n=1 Tax=Burkholderia gladioli TaxID=28095 RepID=UPI003F7AC49D
MKENLGNQHLIAQDPELLKEALTQLNLGNLDKAIAHAREAVSQFPLDAFARLVYGIGLARMGEYPQAIDELVLASRYAPNEPEIRYNLAVVFQQNNDVDMAMVEYAACLEIDGGFADALWNYGELLRLREYFNKSLECFDRLLMIEGVKRPKMAHRMAVCCSRLGRVERANQLFLEELKEGLDPVTQWEYAYHLLASGRWDEGWQNYAFRFDAGEAINLKIENFPFDAWDGTFSENSLLVVHGEQGIGDEILFSSYIPDLLKRAKKWAMAVFICCRPSLVKLFQSSFPSATVIPHEFGHRAELNVTVDSFSRAWQIPIGDLPRYASPSREISYLVPKDDDVIKFKEILKKEPGEISVGIAWSSNRGATQDSRLKRNVPPGLLNQFAKKLMANFSNVRFYCLLDENHRRDLAYFPDIGIKDVSDQLVDFNCTAALMKSMDVVISVCTATANLAGALGCNSHILLQCYADWRWAFGGKPWYINTQIYRQSVPNDWVSPLASLFSNVEEYVQRKENSDINGVNNE